MKLRLTSKLSDLCTNALWAGVFAAGALLLSAAPAAGSEVGQCFDDSGCSSNDLVVSSATAVGAGADPTCDSAADTIDLELSFTVVVQSGSGPLPEAQQRYDIGVWVFGYPGGQCGREIFTPGNSNAPDFDGDDCHDLTDTPADFAGLYLAVPCTDNDLNGFVDPFQICGSWGSQQNQIGGSGGCTIDTVFPGTNPKCQCTTFDPQIQVPVCGDGVVNQKSEECDDGNTDDTDACGNDCLLPVCGNGQIEDTEQCDDGNQVDTDCCSNACVGAVCGNNVVECTEGCDDGNQVDTDACTSACVPAVCGDGFVQDGVEQCDDANQVNTDECTNACALPVCGDGITTPTLGENCDDGNTTPGDGCNAVCHLEGCGNGKLEEPEACDDGNAINCDGCSTSCVVEGCGNGAIECTEECDDGNVTPGDGCDGACGLETVCGNGVVEGVEQCDDGNVLDNDGCSAICTIEVPTMGEYGLGALALLLIGAGFVAVRKGNLI